MFTCVINGKTLSFETKEERDQAVAAAQSLPERYTVESIQGEAIAQDPKKAKDSANGDDCGSAKGRGGGCEYLDWSSINELESVLVKLPGSCGTAGHVACGSRGK